MLFFFLLFWGGGGCLVGFCGVQNICKNDTTPLSQTYQNVPVTSKRYQYSSKFQMKSMYLIDFIDCWILVEVRTSVFCSLFLFCLCLLAGICYVYFGALMLELFLHNALFIYTHRKKNKKQKKLSQPKH